MKANNWEPNEKDSINGVFKEVKIKEFPNSLTEVKTLENIKDKLGKLLFFYMLIELINAKKNMMIAVLIKIYQKNIKKPDMTIVEFLKLRRKKGTINLDVKNKEISRFDKSFYNFIKKNRDNYIKEELNNLIKSLYILVILEVIVVAALKKIELHQHRMKRKISKIS